jgi:hypothetical protein
MSRFLREQVVLQVDSIISVLKPNTKGRRPKLEPVQAAARDAIRTALGQLKTLRTSLRVRTRRDGQQRKTSEFNMFVRDTMKDLQERGIKFGSTTDRMRECGRLWKLKKEEDQK